MLKSCYIKLIYISFRIYLTYINIYSIINTIQIILRVCKLKTTTHKLIKEEDTSREGCIFFCNKSRSNTPENTSLRTLLSRPENWITRLHNIYSKKPCSGNGVLGLDLRNKSLLTGVVIYMIISFFIL